MPTSCFCPAVSTAFLALVCACAPANPHPQPSPSSAVTAEDIQSNPNDPVEMVLQRKVPGLEVTRGLYGIQGMNGVIVITTKKAGKQTR